MIEVFVAGQRAIERKGSGMTTILWGLTSSAADAGLRPARLTAGVRLQYQWN